MYKQTLLILILLVAAQSVQSWSGASHVCVAMDSSHVMDGSTMDGHMMDDHTMNSHMMKTETMSEPSDPLHTGHTAESMSTSAATKHAFSANKDSSTITDSLITNHDSSGGMSCCDDGASCTMTACSGVAICCLDMASVIDSNSTQSALVQTPALLIAYSSPLFRPPIL
ncbi:hypothetical protein [Pleionea mediterranea]|uniref:Uncharacterized protein n=1 Tax=Pleionea mediterranea TaxID=523701 RepID=A0A316FEJ9_9GAMM|nr:hypothetical protein [Pleionea mediterranea]PWK47331.1 hypothetical protein C8D97_11176 [Pleionea mediterranea]